MPRYVAFLRGVSPQNASMPELQRAFEAAGFTDVKTVLASGNVVFNARVSATAVLEEKAQAAMQATLGKSFTPFVRSAEHLLALLQADPFAAFGLPAAAKPVVTFLPKPAAVLPPLPLEADGVHLLEVRGLEVFTAYLPHPKGPVFMRLIESHIGKNQTTRTWATVAKCAQA
jgi:uncharacterized protein (DUF1697 family)